MKINQESIEVYILLFSVSTVFLILGSAIVYFVLMYRKKQLANKAEKNALTLHYESEILKTQIEVQEQTMQTIAAELHDNIGQLLSLTSLTLNTINLAKPEKVEGKVATSLSLVNKSIKELRDVAKLLQGELIIETGLGKAIKQELDRLKRIGGYKLKVKNQLIDLMISSPKKDLIILRLLQEIINNIIKHAQATHIEVNTHFIVDTLFLFIEDNGIGFNYLGAEQSKSGMGLQSIHKRIEMIKGKIAIDSIPQRGTAITIEIPYP